MYKVSKEVYILLYELYVLACMREPVQGKFSFSRWNRVEYLSNESYTEKEGVLNCGTFGCLAGGYIPLVDKRFGFTEYGFFEVKETIGGNEVSRLLSDSRIWRENAYLFRTLFTIDGQLDFKRSYNVDLVPLNMHSTKEEALDNFRKVLQLLTYNAYSNPKPTPTHVEEHYKSLLARFNHTNRKPKPMTIEAFREWFKRYARLDIFRDSTEYRESILNDFVSGSWYEKE